MIHDREDELEELEEEREARTEELDLREGDLEAREDGVLQRESALDALLATEMTVYDDKKAVLDEREVVLDAQVAPHAKYRRDHDDKGIQCHVPTVPPWDSQNSMILQVAKLRGKLADGEAARAKCLEQLVVTRAAEVLQEITKMNTAVKVHVHCDVSLKSCQSGQGIHASLLCQPCVVMGLHGAIPHGAPGPGEGSEDAAGLCGEARGQPARGRRGQDVQPDGSAEEAGAGQESPSGLGQGTPGTAAPRCPCGPGAMHDVRHSVL